MNSISAATIAHALSARVVAALLQTFPNAFADEVSP
jgi:hypothetical protein